MAATPDGGFARESADGTTLLKLHVRPGAKRTAVSGVFGEALKLELQAPPVDGKANAALLKFLANELNLPKSAVTLTAGECSRDKTVKIRGATPQTVITVLRKKS